MASESERVKKLRDRLRYQAQKVTDSLAEDELPGSLSIDYEEKNLVTSKKSPENLCDGARESQRLRKRTSFQNGAATLTSDLLNLISYLLCNLQCFISLKGKKITLNRGISNCLKNSDYPSPHSKHQTFHE